LSFAKVPYIGQFAHVFPVRSMPSVLQSRFAESEQFLFGRFNFERIDGATRGDVFRLETIGHLLRRRGEPHLAYPVIHVAGTKGKGSVVSLIAAILQAAGYRTGLYRSPHLETVRERFAIDGGIISEDDFADLIDSMRPDIAALDRECRIQTQLHPPTFFEITTSAAFDHFARQQVDVAVIEVGMGGRLDSTNVCRPLLTLITNIGIDHQRQLGRTKVKIAGEKAGIIKPGAPLICGVREPDPAAAIRTIADAAGVPSYWLGEHFQCRLLSRARNAEMAFSTSGNVGQSYQLSPLRMKMYGRHQAINGALSVAAAQWLASQGWEVDEPAVRAGLENCAVDGRFQVFDRRPLVVVDIAHNEISTRAFVAALLDRYPDMPRRTLLFSASKDKKIPRLMRLLFPHFERVVLTSIVNNPRACALEALKEMAQGVRSEGGRVKESLAVEAHADPRVAWEAATSWAGPQGLITICGSAFLVGQMLPLVRES
jgi:dihydrofolate synthase/folylpolyglutamate synthase